MAEQAALANGRLGLHSNSIVDDGAIQEMDEDYDDSSEMEDEDEFNVNIQKKSMENNGEIFTRSQTEPHGDLSQYAHQYKGGKAKHVTKIKKVNNEKDKNGKHRKKNDKNNKNHKNKKKNKKQSELKTPQNTTAALTKAKSEYNLTENKRKKTYKRDDEEDVDVESLEDDEFDDNFTMNDDDAYLDMSITAQDLANMSSSSQINENDKNKKNRSSTLSGLMKNGFKKARGIMSPGVDGKNNNLTHTQKILNGDRGNHSPASNGKYSPTPDAMLNRPISSSQSHSESEDKRKDSTNSRKDSSSSTSSLQHIKKSSISASLFGGGANILSKGKGLFRSNSNKEAIAKFQ
eukprot:195579_1